MKLAVCGWLSIALSCHAADWRETLSPPTPGSFPPPRSMTASYRFGWSKLLAAKATADLQNINQRRSEFVVKAATAGLVRTLWRFDAIHHATADAKRIRPIRVDQLEVYRGQRVETHLEFDRTGVIKQRQELPQDDKPKRKTIKIPNLYDLQTALLFVRSKPLNAGERYRLIVYPGTTSYLATISVVGNEKIRLRSGWREAIKLQLRLNRIEKDFSLQPHTKYTSGFAWLSADSDRLLLRSEVQIFVGKVWMEIDEIKFTGDSSQAAAL